MQAFIDELLQPWKNLPKTIGLYAVAWLSGAVVLTLLHVAFPANKQVVPTNVNQELKAAPDGVNDKAGSDLISSWQSVQKTDDIAALNKFINRFPNSKYTGAAWDRLSQLVQGGALKVAGEDVGLDIIATVLQHENDATAPFASIVNYYELTKKYPLGFALFYSDGHQILYSGENINSNVSFDPGNIKVLSLDAFQLCFSGFVWNGPGTRIIMDNNCFFAPPGTKIEFYRGRDVAVVFESLAVSPSSAAAWVIGLHN